MYQVDINDIIRNYEFRDDEGFLFCLFEAVSNALYCCADNNDIKIAVQFTREYRTNELTKNYESVITAFSVTDNGKGFTQENFDQFAKTIYKTNHAGGKGLGRVAFLKVFNDVYIESYFKEHGKYYSRNFKFDTSTIKDTKQENSNKQEPKTTVYLKNIKGDFRDDTKKTTEYYAEALLNHFYIHLYYLLEQEKEFEIKIIDDGEKVTEEIINSAKLKGDKVTKDNFAIRDPQGFDGIGTVSFDILHIKTKNIKGNKVFYVVDERSAGEIRKINMPPSLLEDKTGYTYNYYVYLKSDFFNKFLNESRTKLSLPTESKKSNKNFITEDTIVERLQGKIDTFLEYELGILRVKTEQKISETLVKDENNRTVNNKSYLYILADDKTKEELLKK